MQLITLNTVLLFISSPSLSRDQSPLELQGHIEWASAIVLVYDVTDRHSFNSIIKLINVVTACRNNFSPIALVGNKDDLAARQEARQVEKSEGRNLASKYNLYFFEVRCTFIFILLLSSSLCVPLLITICLPNLLVFLLTGFRC